MTAMSVLEFTLPAKLEAHEPPEARGQRRDGVRLLVGAATAGQVSGGVSGLASGGATGQANGEVSGQASGGPSGGANRGASGWASGGVSGQLSGGASGGSSGLASGGASGGESGEVSHHRFTDLPDLLRPGDVLVVNTSGTLPAAVPVAGASADRALLHRADATAAG